LSNYLFLTQLADVGATYTGINTKESPSHPGCRYTLQTDAQLEMMQKMGRNGICIDATHGTNPCDYLLITVLVIDDHRKRFPVAWFVTPKEDEASVLIWSPNILCQMMPQLTSTLGHNNSSNSLSNNQIDEYESMLADIENGQNQLRSKQYCITARVIPN
uniref:MULE transposase domain-containing protein n=1 Tax=Romanomermis culicivorax TaxID=13658 RepID=A0A915KG09_ROMCU